MLYGSILRLDHALFTLKLRSGRLVIVDSTAAVASGRFSAPLFVGKPVVVQGDFDSRGLLHAQTIERLTRIDSSLGPDR